MRDVSATAVASVLIAAVVLVAPVAVEALEVSVRGEAQIMVDVETAGTTVQIGGRLRDDLGDSLAARGVDVVVRQDRRVVFEDRLYTDFFGLFSTVTELAPGEYEVDVEYPGSSSVSGIAQTQTVDVEASPTRLSLGAPAWVHGLGAPAPLQLRATAEGRGLATFASVSVNNEAVASVALDGVGRAGFDVGPFLEPGQNLVSVEVGATEFRDARVEEVAIRQVIEPTLEGESRRVFRRMRRGVEVDMVLNDKRGPIEGAGVEVQLQPGGEARKGDEGVVDPLFDAAQTGPDGRTTHFFSDDALGDTPWRLTARVQPPEGEVISWNGPIVHNEPSVWMSMIRFLAAFALGIGALWLGRRGLLLVWAGFREHFGDDDDQSRDAQEKAEIFDEVEDIVLEPNDGVVASGDKNGEAITVELWDEWRGRPVDDAVIEVIAPGDESVEVYGDHRGMADLECEVEGTWTLRAQAPGYVTAQSRLQIPAAVNSLRLVMTPVPLKIRRAYRWMMRQTGGRDQWGRLTPRQIENALRGVEDAGHNTRSTTVGSQWREILSEWEHSDESERIDLLLQAITAVVEETNFSGRDYDRQVWEATKQAMEYLVQCMKDERVDGGRL